MAAPKIRQGLEAVKRAAGGEQTYYVTIGDVDWGVDDAIRAQCRVGANWIGDRLFVMHPAGYVTDVVCALPAPSRAVLEAEGIRLLHEAVQERARQNQHSIRLMSNNEPGSSQPATQES